jgi:hypothetical protein
MAKKEQNVMLLQEVVGQLRKLNASSVRDRLRESEEAKRAEQIALQGETQEVQQESIVSSSEDFRRRFIAGQAKTFVDTNITKTAEGKKNTERNRLLKSINSSIVSTWDEEKQEFIGNKLLDVGTFADAHIDVKHLLLGIGDILSQIAGIHTTQYGEETKRFNTQLRLQEEARREAIKLGGPGARGIGQTMALPDLSDIGGIGFSESVLANALGGAAGAGGVGLLAGMKKWFGFGTKRGFKRVMSQRFKKLGLKIFKGYRLSKKMLGMLGNPRRWPLVLATLLAGSFLGIANSDDGEEMNDVELTSDVLPPEDLPDLPGQGAFSKSIDNMFIMAGTASLLSRATIVQNVAKQVGDKLRTTYKNAPKNSLRGRLYSNPGFKRGLSLTGRGLLRFMGPWGFGAWVAWELGSWAMKSYAQNEEEAEAALDTMINDVAADTTDLIGPNSNDELARLLAPDRNNGAFSSADRKNKAIAKIKELMKAKTASQRDKLIKQLGFLGWNVDELAGILNSAGVNDILSRDRDGDLFSNLKVEEKERLQSLGSGGTRGPTTIITGNSGDMITNNHTHVHGYQLRSVFEGVTSDMLAYP